MVKVTKESVTSTEVTLNVQLDSEDEDPFLDRSYRRTVNQIKIPGFRPGKAPGPSLKTMWAAPPWFTKR